jgi:hypothetical protein
MTNIIIFFQQLPRGPTNFLNKNLSGFIYAQQLGKVQAGTTTLGACTFWVGGTHPWRGYNNMGRYIDMGTVSDIRSRKKDDIIVGTSKYDTLFTSTSNSSSILHNSSKK